MHSGLSENDCRAIGKDVGISPAGTMRLLGSVVIATMSPGVEESSQVKREFNIGLRLSSQDILLPLLSSRPRAELYSFFTKALQEYRSQCPLIVQWIARGDFNPKKPPSQVTYPTMLHGNRSAGRIRASVLRETRKACVSF